MYRHVQARPGMWNFILEPEEAGDDVETFRDAPEDSDHEAGPAAASTPAAVCEGAKDQRKASKAGTERAGYDMRKRCRRLAAQVMSMTVGCC